MQLSERLRHELQRELAEQPPMTGLSEVLSAGRRRRSRRKLASVSFIVLLLAGLSLGTFELVSMLRPQATSFVQRPGPPGTVRRGSQPFSQVTIEEARARAPYRILVPEIKGTRIQRVDYSDQVGPGGNRIFSVDLFLSIRGKPVHAWMTNDPQLERSIDQARGFRGMELISGRQWRRQDLQEPQEPGRVTLELSRRLSRTFWIELDGVVSDSFLRSVVVSLR